jgi:hypothetical protein
MNTTWRIESWKEIGGRGSFWGIKPIVQQRWEILVIRLDAPRPRRDGLPHSQERGCGRVDTKANINMKGWVEWM